MGFLDKAKQAAEQAANRANETVSDVQAKRELTKAYTDLGEKTFELSESGAISHPDLQADLARIRELHAKLGEEAPEVPAQEAVEQPLSGADLPTG